MKEKRKQKVQNIQIKGPVIDVIEEAMKKGVLTVKDIDFSKAKVTGIEEYRQQRKKWKEKMKKKYGKKN